MAKEILSWKEREARRRADIGLDPLPEIKNSTFDVARGIAVALILGVLFWIVAAVAALVLAGCGEQAQEQGASAGSGVLCSIDFQACVLPVLSGQIRRSDGAIVNCASATCHRQGGNSGGFVLSGDANADMQAVQTFSNSGNLHASPVLTKPAGEVIHGGGRVFSGRSDPCYVAIYNWISNQVDPALGDASPACGQCVPVAIAGCGF